jgi:hypothetical protein
MIVALTMLWQLEVTEPPKFGHTHGYGTHASKQACERAGKEAVKIQGGGSFKCFETKAIHRNGLQR